ncbi:hypothetical protein [Mollivirus kamchatka]|nr:hypothetical protein [Mollivirus kamchatka]
MQALRDTKKRLRQEYEASMEGVRKAEGKLSELPDGLGRPTSGVERMPCAKRLKTAKTFVHLFVRKPTDGDPAWGMFCDYDTQADTIRMLRRVVEDNAPDVAALFGEATYREVQSRIKSIVPAVYTAEVKTDSWKPGEPPSQEYTYFLGETMTVVHGPSDGQEEEEEEEVEDWCFNVKDQVYFGWLNEDPESRSEYTETRQDPYPGGGSFNTATTKMPGVLVYVKPFDAEPFDEQPKTKSLCCDCKTVTCRT